MKKDNPLVEYQPVSPAKDFFENIAEKEKSRLKKHLSLSSSLNLMLNQIYSGLLKFVEEIIGIKLYTRIDDSPMADISPKTKKLVANLIQKKIIKQIVRIPRVHHDEPKIIHYTVKMPDAMPDISLYSDGRGGSTLSGGADLNEERALMKAVGEGLERFCLCVYREKNCLLAPYNKISKKALNPLSIAGVSNEQRQSESLNKLKIDENSLFRWVKGFSLYNKKKIFIPAQLVYVGYKYHSKEPVISQQNSTGAAAADSFEEALYRGICEAVERDALVITYFNKLSPPIIELEEIADQNFQKLLAMFRRYNLELYVIDMTTDIAIPSMLAVIIDRTGIGHPIHLGAKTSLDIKKAVIGAVYEALRGRVGHRGVPFSTSPLKEKVKELRTDPSQIKVFQDRFLYWASLDILDKVNFLFQGPPRKISEEEFNKYKNFNNNPKLKIALSLLQERGVDVYGVDITMPQIKKEGIYVAKVICPQLQPIFFIEKFKHLFGERLFKVPVILGYYKKPLSENELNPIPHPFL